jgi:hypothetical protein
MCGRLFLYFLKNFIEPISELSLATVAEDTQGTQLQGLLLQMLMVLLVAFITTPNQEDFILSKFI